MRKLLMWIVVSVGIAALIRKFKRHGEEGMSEVESGHDEPAAADLAGDDPADELRRKLADTRDDAAPVTEAEPDATVDERRSEVHDEGRAAIDEMQRSTD